MAGSARNVCPCRYTACMDGIDSKQSEAAQLLQRRLPYLTADLPGIGGTLKQSPDDFEVEELPAYQPVGEGEHLFVWIEKQGRSAAELTDHVARTLGLKPHQISTAGMKDRQAVTRQYVCVPAECEQAVGSLNADGFEVLAARRHTNKLKTGHLRGNRFSILVRDVADHAEECVPAITKRIERAGFPNYFGPQRFGNAGETLTLGFDLLKQRQSRRRLPPRQRKWLTRLALSAAQSHLFNQALGRRLAVDNLERVIAGDVMQVVASGGCFVVEDVEQEQPRFEAGETVVSGPIFGPKMKRPTGRIAEQETSVLQEHGLTGEEFREFGKLTLGTRRPYLIRPSEFSLVREKDGLRFRFTLPSGVYATTLLREFMKNDP